MQVGIIRAYYGPRGRTPPAAALPDDPYRFRTPKAIDDFSMRKHALSILALAALCACVYQAPIAQGNLLKQEDIDQVEVGMTRSQVRFLLGTPMIDDPFHANRWDYVYYLKIGRRDATFKRWVSILFDGDRVSEIIEDQELNPKL